MNRLIQLALGVIGHLRPRTARKTAGWTIEPPRPDIADGSPIAEAHAKRRSQQSKINRKMSRDCSRDEQVPVYGRVLLIGTLVATVMDWLRGLFHVARRG